jgi:hypothetical protein
MPDGVRSRHRTRWIVLAATATIVIAGSLYYALGSATPCNYPSDPRSYGPEPCWGWYVQGATTFQGALGHYGVTLPAHATGIRFYLDGGAFNGGDGFYVRFNAPRAELARSLAQMNAMRTDDDPRQTLQNQSTTEPALGWALAAHDTYSVWTYAYDPSQVNGSIIVDDDGSEPVVYLMAGS